MASSEVAVPFLQGSPAGASCEKFSSPSSKVWNVQTSVAAPATPEIYSWPASYSDAASVERNGNSSTSLPVIDLGGLRSGDPTARAKIVRELGAATEAWGFFQIVNHSVGDDLQARMEKQARQFFSLPLDVRSRAEIVGPNPRLFGYKGLFRPGKGWSTEERVLIKESLADSRAASYSLEDLASKIWPEGNLTFRCARIGSELTDNSTNCCIRLTFVLSFEVFRFSFN